MMKAIILAAGTGRRLLPLTEKTPKTMLPVGNRPILYYQLEALKKYMEQSDIYIITGHGSESIEIFAKGCSIIFNEKFLDTNNIYSLALAKDITDEPFILLNSDVVFDDRILEKLITTPFEDAMMIDDVKQLADEEMKVLLDQQKIVEINKTMDPNLASGEYIGLAKFSKEGARVLFNKIQGLLAEGRYNEWYEKGIEAACKEISIYGISTSGLPWIEIDNHEDLTRAQDIIKEINKRNINKNT